MSRLVSVFRLAAMLSLAAVTLGFAATAASAAPATTLDANLAALWTKVLETPNPQPFSTPPGGSPCWVLPDGTVAPFGPGADGGSCTVKPGTKIFVAAYSFECSTFPGDTNPTSPTEPALRACAENAVGAKPSVRVDDRPVPVTEAETGLLHIVLPADNVFGLPAGTAGLSFGVGWVTLLHPLARGTHIIVGSGGVAPFTTTIIVKPR